jgi:dihydropteroate synthase
MGIVNVTPDSFSGDGQLKSRRYVQDAVSVALRMIKDGADIVDVGGESTRPGARAVSAIEECRRVVPVIEALSAARKTALISVDTSKAAVAKAALNAGADIVNVVQGNNIPSGLFTAVQKADAGIVLMHMRGTPRTMMRQTKYHDLWTDIVNELKGIARFALDAGINRDNIVIDPGIGFAKTAVQNLALIRDFGRLKTLGFPLLAGVSRKSFIGAVLGREPQERLAGTVAAVMAVVLQGAHIVRVHDVPEIIEAVRVADAIRTVQLERLL